MEDFEFDYDVEERSWIAAMLINATSLAMNLTLVVGLTYWMVG